MAQWDKDEQQALFDKGVLERLMKDIDAIATGKVNEFSLSGMKFDLMQKTRAEATAQNMQNLIGSSIDLAQKIGQIGKTKQEKKNLEVTYDKTVISYRDWESSGRG